ncbi:MAG: alanyl-tRNA editing protein [Oscillospiraceae bacterium]|nr:alanyl-tRNA editing protein [Oscillospiraceae bacterium]
MTRKLYYEDCHLSRFYAAVEACEKCEKGYEIRLDATAFYPEGGGQACDLGTLDGAAVLDVQERDGQIVHLCAQALEVGTQVEGIIDYGRRFGLMQQHTGEHIVSGIIHRRYGYHNVGFHMGSEMIEIDFDGLVPAEDLPLIEAEANAALWQNLPVKCWYPSPEELPHVFYRTKRALPWPVRIVQIPGYDSCACCGVHVAHTGEVGLVKLFSVVGLRGGCRIEMSCGGRALNLLNRAFEQNRLVSQTFSAKWPETGEAARKINEALTAEKYRAAGLQKRIFENISKNYVNLGDVVHFESGLEAAGVRMLADAIAEICGGTAAVFSGSDGEGYGFAMVTREGDLRALGKKMTAALQGRGGGKPNFQQGRVAATRQEIERFFMG